MKKLVVDGKELPIYVETVDGVDCYLVAERSDSDGGIVTNTYVDDGKGATLNYRTWRGSGKGEGKTDEVKAAAQAEALSVFASLTKQDIAARVGKAQERGVSGTLKRE